MKKILLIIAAIVCVSIAGTALAVSYYNADDIDGTVTADKYVVLSLDNSTAPASISLVGGEVTTFKIQCDVDASATAAPNGTLTIALIAGTEKSLAGVTLALYSDMACTQAVLDDTDTPIAQTGAGTITIEGIDDDAIYYAKVTFAGAADAAALAAIGGSITIDFENVVA